MDDAGDVKMVSLIRTGSATHTLAQDQVYVRVPYVVTKDKDNKGKSKGKGKAYGHNMIEVSAPTKPVQAKPGDYMLFVVNQAGTPSMAKHIRLGVDSSGNGDKGYVRTFTKKFPGDTGGKDNGKDKGKGKG